MMADSRDSSSQDCQSKRMQEIHDFQLIVQILIRHSYSQAHEYARSTVMTVPHTFADAQDGPAWNLHSSASSVFLRLPQESCSTAVFRRLSHRCERLLDQALSCSKLADVRFLFEDGHSTSSLSGHKSMLCAASDVFRSMFHNNMREEQTGDVQIVGASRNSFRAFLEFMYLGEQDILNSIINTLS
jgi:hypothetical protein